MKVVKAFMRAGIPIGMLDILRDILEEKALRLADTTHAKFVSVIFDGTSRLGEVLAIVLRYVEDYKIKQRLICLEILTKICPSLRCPNTSGTSWDILGYPTLCPSPSETSWDIPSLIHMSKS